MYHRPFDLRMAVIPGPADITLTQNESNSYPFLIVLRVEASVVILCKNVNSSGSQPRVSLSQVLVVILVF